MHFVCISVNYNWFVFIFDWESLLLQCKWVAPIHRAVNSGPRSNTYFLVLSQWLVPVQPIIQVLLIIVSCLLAWGEAWFLDCRVIPQEKSAQRFYRALMVQPTTVTIESIT